MTESAPVHVPARYARVNPWVISSDTDAEIAFLTASFGAVETPASRLHLPDGRIGHVEVELGDAVLMLFDSSPDWAPTPAHLRVYVGNVDEVFQRALEAGARAVTQPTDLPFGERVARVRDVQGHLWWIHQHLEDVTPEQVAVRFDEPGARAAMAYVQDSLTQELSPSSNS